MLILALESSAKAASCALVRDGGLVAQSFLNSGLTHSRTLLPMAEDMLKNAGLEIKDIDCVAVAQGPGSFTGIRIGVAAVKGLCWGADKPAVGVSTLEAMAAPAVWAGEGATLCCAMDARRNQVYNALFRIENGEIKRLCPDRAISLAELGEELKAINGTIWVMGDGGKLCFDTLGERFPNMRLAPEGARLQCALGVALAARVKTPVSAGELLPVYLRLSQAERERLERMNNK